MTREETRKFLRGANFYLNMTDDGSLSEDKREVQRIAGESFASNFDTIEEIVGFLWAIWDHQLTQKIENSLAKLEKSAC